MNLERERDLQSWIIWSKTFITTQSFISNNPTLQIYIALVYLSLSTLIADGIFNSLYIYINVNVESILA